MKPQAKLDLYRQHAREYAVTTQPTFVEIGPATYLAITGQGAPGGQAFTDRIGALYGVAFTIKMTRKFAGRRDYAVGKLEAQWWHDDASGSFAQFPREEWRWRLLIRTPDFINPDDLAQAVTALLKRRKPPTVREVRLESFAGGRCVQMLHVGPYEREGETVAIMKAHAEKHGLQFRGRHHEIYLSDPRRVAADRLKTILRQPVGV
jgi:hypothetical protein